MAAPRRPAWLTGPVTIPTVLSFILGATVDVALLAYGARRLLAERRFSLSRTIVAGLAVLLAISRPGAGIRTAPLVRAPAAFREA